MSIDLNLLLVFDAVMSERHVGRAAERLGRSQPAVSQAIARLRDLFADRLFLKTPVGVAPTPRAEALWAELREPLAGLRATVAPDAFEPRHATGEVVIGLSDDMQILALAEIGRAIGRAAPRLAVRVVEVDHQSAAGAARDGAVDLAVTVIGAVPRGLARKELFRQPFVLLGRHPLPETLRAYLDREHIGIAFSAGERGYVDERLAEMGHARRMAIATPRFAVVPMLLTGERIATLPGPVALALARLHRLATAPVPFDLPAVPVAMAWHERRRHDPRHRWLRDTVEAAVTRARARLDRGAGSSQVDRLRSQRARLQAK